MVPAGLFGLSIEDFWGVHPIAFRARIAEIERADLEPIEWLRSGSARGRTIDVPLSSLAVA